MKKHLALFGIASIAVAAGAASSTVAMGQQGYDTTADVPVATAGGIGAYDPGAGDFDVFVDAFAGTDSTTAELAGTSLVGTDADKSADFTVFAHGEGHEHGSFRQLMTEWMGACLLYKDDVLADAADLPKFSEMLSDHHLAVGDVDGATWTKTDSVTTLDATIDVQDAHQSDGGWYDRSETNDWGTKDSGTNDWGSNDWGTKDWGRTP